MHKVGNKIGHSTCFGRSFRSSSGVQDCTNINRYMSKRYCCLLTSRQATVSVWHVILLYVQSWTPDDGRKERPKHVEFYSNIKINLRILVGFSWLYYRNTSILRCTVLWTSDLYTKHLFKYWYKIYFNRM